MANKVKFGLCNVYYSKMTETTQGETYATPVAMPGAVNLSLAAEGSSEPKYADNQEYYTAITNNGYSGTLELALIPDSFKSDILGDVVATQGGLVEKSNVATTYFALLFEFNGDDKARRHVMYKCSATRPDVASATVEASKTPVTETLNIKAIPNKNEIVKWFVDQGSSVYTSWFSSVQTPTISQ